MAMRTRNIKYLDGCGMAQVASNITKHHHAIQIGINRWFISTGSEEVMASQFCPEGTMKVVTLRALGIVSVDSGCRLDTGSIILIAPYKQYSVYATASLPIRVGSHWFQLQGNKEVTIVSSDPESRTTLSLLDYTKCRKRPFNIFPKMSIWNRDMDEANPHENTNTHRLNINEQIGGGFNEIESAIGSRLKTFWITPEEDGGWDVVSFLNSIREQLIAKIIEQANGENEELDTSFKTRNRRELLLIDQTDEIVDESFSKLLKEKSEFQAKGSEWALSGFIGLELHINKFQPLRGSRFLEKLNETCLPPKEDFFNRLTDSDISDEDYTHAKTVWEAFECKTLGDYSDIYLKSDVTLLADVFENFRNVCFEADNLDPAWYYIAPELTFDAMLKHTGIELELLTDYHMILMVEKGICGGISQCCKRYAEANNKYMKEYDSKSESRFLSYLDANILYGWALSRPLPYSNFRWLSPNEITDFSVNEIPEYNEKGYILEVDLEYPESLHEKHSDLPLCPENKAPPGGKLKKLLTTLENKLKYTIHYVNLKQALSLGIILKKCHEHPFNICPEMSIWNRDMSKSCIMAIVNIAIRKIPPSALVPIKSYNCPAGFDSSAIQSDIVHGQGRCLVPTGLSFEIPKGLHGRTQET
ncbi:hypothetical protein J437_LFUL015860 [Ladona fulva]|uniref:DNA-directed DNA polymerase n=1 Tax=Ladona fulva TaxID=123851 RepID=A0A8K0KHL6_LADFU|nr:hypothetical protein J437_LFUL015860 [Ladona fulva]